MSAHKNKACARITCGVYLAHEVFLRQDETPQLNALFSWKLCTGNRTHEAEDNKNKRKEEDDKAAISCSVSSCCCVTSSVTDLSCLKPALSPGLARSLRRGQRGAAQGCGLAVELTWTRAACVCPAAQAGHWLVSEPLGKEAISAGSPQFQTQLRLGPSAREAGDHSSLQS